jgi:predicted transcriptional regulator
MANLSLYLDNADKGVKIVLVAAIVPAAYVSSIFVVAAQVNATISTLATSLQICTHCMMAGDLLTTAKTI